jgi:NAD+ kinase
MSPLNLGIYTHWRKPGAMESLLELEQVFRRENIQVHLETETAEAIGRVGESLVDLKKNVDAFVVLGGDGTLLRLVRDLNPQFKPIMGINFGSLGFLTCFGGPGFSAAAKALATGEYRVDERTMLEATIERNGTVSYRAMGLNDVVASRGERSRLVQLDVTIDSTYLTQYNADGLIIATATGSTAYSLSAGGPIVTPDAGVFVVSRSVPRSNQTPVVVSNRPLFTCASRSDQPVFLSKDGKSRRSSSP